MKEMLHQLLRRSLLLSVFSGAVLGSVNAKEPTAVEQYYLELVNRARANPAAEVARISSSFPEEPWGDNSGAFARPQTPSLNEGLPAGTIPNSPVQPLAFATNLQDSASNYADLLLADEAFSHSHSGTPSSRALDVGYVQIDGGENISLTTSSDGVPPLDSGQASEHHINLFIDGDIVGRGHRKEILNNSFKEVGLAIRGDSDSDSFFGSPFDGDVISVQHFGTSSGRSFVTGVAFNDTGRSPNSFYNPGEGIADLTIEVLDSSGVVLASASNFTSGGYSLNIASLAEGAYRLRAKNAAGQTTTPKTFSYSGSNVKVDFVSPTFSNAPTPSAPVLNLSTRGFIGTGDKVLIGGIIIGGTGTKKLLINGRGPSIPDSVPNRLSNPKLTLVNASGTVIATNDDWINSPDSEAIANTVTSGGPGGPAAAQDASLLIDLPPGAYTAIVAGESDTEGVGIVEFFDLETSSSATIENLSTRGNVQTGDNVLIGGVIIGGEAPADVTIVYRGRGPSMPTTVPNRLADPTLTLYNSASVPIATVDNWNTGESASPLSSPTYSTYAPENGFESAVIRNLNPGAYTAILRGTEGATGIGIVELFIQGN